MPEILDLQDGQEFDLGGGRIVTAYACPGHTAGEMVFLDSATRSLIAGDALNYNLGLGAVPLETTVRALERLKAMGDRYDGIYNGHHDFRAFGAPLDDDCLENVMVLQEPVCAKKRIKLELKKSVSMPDQAIGDKAKLQRALVSLLESAIEQTPGGGVINLGCRADRASGNRAYMYFTIRDSGSSIASDLMQGMFEMKDEKDDPLRAGLYIAREIVSIMGGNVRVRSRRGEGTEFMVTVCMKLP
jgi:signal transduction histidine kinase